MPVTTQRAAPASIAHQSQALPPGTRLGEFEVVTLLGAGGFGMVYQAFDHSLQRFVAIKEYLPAALAGRADGHSLWVRSSSDEQSFQAGLASFVDEARLLARFDHPSLAKVLRFWEANQTAYMVMPLYRGMTLKQARAQMRAPPPEAWLRSLLWSVASALHVLHEGQALHRDISPDNIFLQDLGPPVLLDLGAARHAISSRKHPAVMKVNYAPLEQHANAPAHLQQGPWSDLYALGAMVHGCLCHNMPQPATQRALRDRMAPFARVARSVHRQFGVEYSRTFVEAIAQCLQLQPQDRPQSVTEFLQAMDMAAPPAGLESFDFRAGLGANWVEPQGSNAQGVALPLIHSQALSRVTLEAVHSAASAAAGAQTGASAIAPGAAPQALPEHARRSRQRLRAHRKPRDAGRHGRALWAVAGSAALLAMAAGLWSVQKPRTPRQTPESEIITELAEPARLSQPAAMVQPVSGSDDRAAAAGQPIIPMVRAVQPSEPMPVPAAALEPAAPPPRLVPPAPVPDPIESCASAGFWGRSMCIHRECQSDSMATHPVCVENRMRREEQEREHQLYGQ
ncbi:MAG: serine/threonine protein kinase [Proteobacteria bacterium]|nr:serine/threonine protein kinase [Pseudomonadota bacterium]